MSKVVVLVATRVEGQSLRSQNRIVCGIGAPRAVAALEQVAASGRPRLIIHAGFAGALSPALAVGDVVRPTRVRLESGEEVPVEGGDLGSLLTIDRVATVDDKRRLRAATGCDAVDMESFAVARRAAELGVPLRLVRVISDAAGFALPPESVGWVNPDGSPRIAAVLKWAGVSPARLKLLATLKRNADLAADRLAQAVSEVVRYTSPP